MDNRFVKTSVIYTLILGVIISLYFIGVGLKQGLSVAGGMVFSLLNLWLMWKLIQETITLEDRKRSNIAGLVVLKFIILWGGFIALMALNILSPIHFAIGFTILLFVFSMKAFGRWMVDYFKF
jgi:Kef-type K+ transport system membrane component KefB